LALQASAKEVQDSEGAAMLRDQLKNLAEGLNGAASGMSTVIDGIVKGFPGPLLNSTLAVIERQVRDAGTATAGCHSYDVRWRLQRWRILQPTIDGVLCVSASCCKTADLPCDHCMCWL
jgi:hypothetical protein